MRPILWLCSTRGQNSNSSVLVEFLVVLVTQLKSGGDMGKTHDFSIDFSI